MLTKPHTEADDRLLLLTTTRRDGEVSTHLLASAHIPCLLCHSVAELCHELTRGAAAVMLPEESVVSEEATLLAEQLGRQPVWSDLPVIVLTRTGAESAAVNRALATLGNVSLVERPVRVSTLLSVIRTALRARQRQYQVRDQLVESARNHQELVEARDTAEAASRAKDQFLAVLSHELRTPLSPVVIALSAWESEPSLDEFLREDVAMMRRNIALELQLIDDLLDINRIVSGKLRLQLQPTSVHDVLRHAVENCRGELNEKAIRVVLDLQAEQDEVTADPARLQQVFWNLLKNAAKFTPENGSVTLRSTLDNGVLCVGVTDTGIGVEAGALPRLFDAFDQGDWRTTQKFGGLGLGLAICKAVVEMMSGTITATSEGRGKGTTFAVTLPLTVGASPDRQTPRHPSGGPAPAGASILLVEDHLDTARVLSTLLRRKGYRVTVAHTVATAVREAKAAPIDVIISDIGLPDASGYDLMERIRAYMSAPAVALSGYGTDEDVERSTAAGFAEHAVKPVDFEGILRIVERLLLRDAAAVSP